MHARSSACARGALRTAHSMTRKRAALHPSPVGGEPLRARSTPAIDMKTILFLAASGLLASSLSAQDATVTVLHGVPGLPAPVEVFANGTSLFTFDYGEQRGPLSLGAGSYQLDVRLNGTTILSTTANVAAGIDYSVIANLDAGGAPRLSLFANALDNVTLQTSRLYVRHTAEAPPVDVVLAQNGVDVATIPALANGSEASADVAPGDYAVRLVVTGTSTVAFGPVDVRVENGRGYGVFAVGSAGTPSFRLLTQLVPLTALVTVVHGIPGLPAPVTVTANGTSLFSFDFREVRGPLVVLPGAYTFDVLLNGSPVLSRTDTVARGDDVTVVAHLDATANPVLAAFANDTTALVPGNARVAVRHLAAAPAVDVVVENVGVTLATIPGLSNGNEAVTSLPLGNLQVRLVAGGATVFGPVGFRPVDHVSYQFLALGDFTGGSFTVQLVQRDLAPAVPGEITTSVGGTGCGPTISATPQTFDYGQPFAVRATGAAANAMAVFNFGDSISSVVGLPLPLPLAGIGAPGCFLNTNVLTSLATMTDATGTVELGFTVPTTLFGLLQPGYFQVGTMTTANALGFATSEYLEIR